MKDENKYTPSENEIEMAGQLYMNDKEKEMTEHREGLVKLEQKYQQVKNFYEEVSAKLNRIKESISPDQHITYIHYNSREDKPASDRLFNVKENYITLDNQAIDLGLDFKNLQFKTGVRIAPTSWGSTGNDHYDEIYRPQLIPVTAEYPLYSYTQGENKQLDRVYKFLESIDCALDDPETQVGLTKFVNLKEIVNSEN